MTVSATYILALRLPLKVTRLLWEQEIGSSNLSTPTLEETTNLFGKALFNDEAFLFSNLIILNHQ